MPHGGAVRGMLFRFAGCERAHRPRHPDSIPSPMLYQIHEFNRALLNPAVEFARAGARIFSAPESWLARLPGSARIAAGYELMYRMGKDYPKPQFGIDSVEVAGGRVAVVERAVLTQPFCR